ncbi:MAG: hypothetical protein HUU57_12920 [Bdellovibrio sp.]|nr:hypothetical protein [Bdellovibrio sp.]
MNQESKDNVSCAIWLILFFPVGLYKLWRHSTYSLTIRATISSIFVGVGLLTWASSSPTTTPTLSSSPSTTLRTVATVSPDELDRQRHALEDIVYEMKFKKLNILRAEVRVNLVRWNGFYLLNCEVNTSGNCGLFEVIKEKNGSEIFWVNGKAAGVIGQRYKKSPNVNVNYEISDALKAVRDGR